MTRTVARQIAVRICFSADFHEEDASSILEAFFLPEHYASLSEEDKLFEEIPDDKQRSYIEGLVTAVAGNLFEIDGIIDSLSSTRRIERIPKTALAVLRCALCEILYFDDIPDSVSVNEAVTIAKKFDSPETVSFVNGLLGAYLSAAKDRNPDID
ncbi:MAG: transcription antitermination factor NusB [Oscillospiraceae bacterium]|nr:transcription antitermination factor NusB [Oscillospiraceae bacterium]